MLPQLRSSTVWFLPSYADAQRKRFARPRTPSKSSPTFHLLRCTPAVTNRSSCRQFGGRAGRDEHEGAPYRGELPRTQSPLEMSPSRTRSLDRESVSWSPEHRTRELHDSEFALPLPFQTPL